MEKTVDTSAQDLVLESETGGREPSNKIVAKLMSSFPK